MSNHYEDSTGNMICSECGVKVEGGYCDCVAYDTQKKRFEQMRKDVENELERAKKKFN